MNADDIIYGPINQLEHKDETLAYYRRLGEIIRNHSYKELYPEHEVCEDSCP